MPSEFEALFDDLASPLIESVNGEVVNYIPRGGEAFEIDGAVWIPGDFLAPSPDPNGRVVKASGELWIHKRWFTLHEVDPKEGCDVSINGKLYSSVGPIRDDGENWYVLTLSSKTYTEKSDGGTRRQRQ